MAATDMARNRFRGDRLHSAREALQAATKGKQGSQAWLAYRIGAHVTSISDWERGANEPSARYAAAICAVPELDLDFSDLFGVEPPSSDEDDEEDLMADLVNAFRKVQEVRGDEIRRLVREALAEAQK